MTARSLLTIDRLLKAPYMFLSWATGFLFSIGAAPAKGPVMVIKLMGIGSITRLYSLCQESSVDLQQVILITLDRQKEVAALLGFPQSWIIRTTGPVAFCVDVVKTINRTWRIRPRLIIDFERCSNAVGLFRLLLASGSRTNVVCFENTSETTTHGRQSRFSVRARTVAEMFRIGIQKMTKIEWPASSAIVQIQTQKVLVNCNASEYLLARRYPANSFVELVSQLSDIIPELEFYFTGSVHEREYIDGIVKRLDARQVCTKNVAGVWSLEELCNEMYTCRLFITVDSGPLHLARALDAPTVALWGPTQPVQFDYRDTESFINCSINLACAPCLTHPHSKAMVQCKGAITCMNEMTVEKVMRACMTLLSQKENYRKAAKLSGMRPLVPQAQQQLSL